MNPDKEQRIRNDAMMDAAMNERTETKEAMKGWFLKRYEDPAESTPYDSSEGGYLYQWGGPYDARDILYSKFKGTEDNELIEEAADELEEICPEWERIPTLEDLAPDADLDWEAFLEASEASDRYNNLLLDFAPTQYSIHYANFRTNLRKILIRKRPFGDLIPSGAGVRYDGRHGSKHHDRAG